MNSKLFYLLAFLIVLVSYIFSKNSKSTNMPIENIISEKNGVKTIEILAKGGYFPEITKAEANTNYNLQVNTKSSFDCSLALVIPKLNYKKMLPSSGSTIIPIPPQEKGSEIVGKCSMGMYFFKIDFL